MSLLWNVCSILCPKLCYQDSRGNRENLSGYTTNRQPERSKEKKCHQTITTFSIAPVASSSLVKTLGYGLISEECRYANAVPTSDRDQDVLIQRKN